MHVVTTNKGPVALHYTELQTLARQNGVQLGIEGTVMSGTPAIRMGLDLLAGAGVSRAQGILNGTTNYILTQMEAGSEYDEALADAKREGYAEMDPTEDVSGADAAAKMAILATVAFGSRVTLGDVEFEGIEQITKAHVGAARQMDMVIRLIGRATLVDGRYDVRVSPALVDKAHPLASVEGAFNAVMLQGDAIREITLEGPGAGGIETASAVIADMVSIIGTTGTGFLHNDACWRSLERLPAGELRSPFYVQISVDDRPGVLAHVAEKMAVHGLSVARLIQTQDDGGAVLHVVTHEATYGAIDGALAAIRELPESRNVPAAFPVISERGISELGWT